MKMDDELIARIDEWHERRAAEMRAAEEMERIRKEAEAAERERNRPQVFDAVEWERKREEYTKTKTRNEEESYKLKLWLHQLRFHCHIRGCRNASPSPYIQVYEGTPGFDWGRIEWNEPTEIEQCLMCHKWACTQVPHIYKNVCVECARKLK